MFIDLLGESRRYHKYHVEYHGTGSNWDPEELGLSSLGGQPNHSPPLRAFPPTITR